MSEHNDIDQAAAAMGDEEQLRFILSRGWQWLGFGFVPAPGIENDLGGGLMELGSGVYSLRTAVRECMAREDTEAAPDEYGRYYQGPEPKANPFGSLTISDEQFYAIIAEYGGEQS